MMKCGKESCSQQSCELCSPYTPSDRETLLQKIKELDLLNLELEKKLRRLTLLEMAVRACSRWDMVARELLTAMEG
jgi:hypothetical protein